MGRGPNASSPEKPGFSGGGLFSPLTDLALRKFDGQINESKICQTLKQRKNEANFVRTLYVNDSEDRNC